jgi:cytochrome c
MLKNGGAALLAAAVMTIAGQAYAEGDPAAGEQVFKKCAVCHAVDASKNKGKQGPLLAGVIGRVPGTFPDFKYSKAMVDFGASGKVWDEATLGSYLVDPKGVVPGTKMAFAGLKGSKGPEDVANVIAYLKSVPAPTQ